MSRFRSCRVPVAAISTHYALETLVFQSIKLGAGEGKTYDASNLIFLLVNDNFVKCLLLQQIFSRSETGRTSPDDSDPADIELSGFLGAHS